MQVIYKRGEQGPYGPSRGLRSNRAKILKRALVGALGASKVRFRPLQVRMEEPFSGSHTMWAFLGHRCLAQAHCTLRAHLEQGELVPACFELGGLWRPEHFTTKVPGKVRPVGTVY